MLEGLELSFESRLTFTGSHGCVEGVTLSYASLRAKEKRTMTQTDAKKGQREGSFFSYINFRHVHSTSLLVIQKKDSWYSLIVECQHVAACTVSLREQHGFRSVPKLGSWWLEEELIKL